MKPLKHLCILSFCLVMVLTAEAQQYDTLLQHKDYFNLKRVIATDPTIPTAKRHYYNAFLNNFFNRLDSSNANIQALFAKHHRQLNAAEQVQLLKLQIDNFAKLGQYDKASSSISKLLKEHKSTISQKETEDFNNAAVLWGSLKNVPPQKVFITADSRLEIQRDAATLINVPVSIGGVANHFVFDTGANISVITESNAKKHGITVFDQYIEVVAITGGKLRARTGFAKELKMGNITVYNAIFMIFPDSSLSFAEGKYTIEGILGFPLIEGLGEVVLGKTYIDVPRIPRSSSMANFGLDELTPVIELKTGGASLPFTFDTGAQITHLNFPFFKKYEDNIKKNGTLSSISIGGAAGTTSIPAYNIPVVTFDMPSGKQAFISNVGIKTKSVSENDSYYFGNVGQDLMRQFDEVVINFKYMYVDFKSK